MEQVAYRVFETEILDRVARQIAPQVVSEVPSTSNPIQTIWDIYFCFSPATFSFRHCVSITFTYLIVISKPITNLRSRGSFQQWINISTAAKRQNIDF